MKPQHKTKTKQTLTADVEQSQQTKTSIHQSTNDERSGSYEMHEAENLCKNLLDFGTRTISGFRLFVIPISLTFQLYASHGHHGNASKAHLARH